MFKIREWRQDSGNYYLDDGHNNNLHSDGSVIPCAREYWPTREQAQAVLDKHQPKHVWKHGDVFDEKYSCYPKIYIHVWGEKPQVFHLTGGMYGCNGMGLPACSAVSSYIDNPNATFLFNIADKL